MLAAAPAAGPGLQEHLHPSFAVLAPENRRRSAALAETSPPTSPALHWYQLAQLQQRALGRATMTTLQGLSMARSNCCD